MHMSYQDIFGSSTDSDASVEGFSVTEMTKRRKPPLPALANSHRRSLELGFFLSKAQPN